LNNDQGIAVGYEKSYKNLRMFTIFGAGHSALSVIHIYARVRSL
jgi:uncharacterized phosphosugar-binding protein